MYEYIYVIIIFFLLFLFAYIKIRYPFWNMQPVFHSYDYWRYFARTPFQIQYGKSLKTKYTTPKTVQTYAFLDISEKQLSQFVDLLQCHYISSEHILTMVDKQTIQTYLTGQGQSSYVSFFQEDSYKAIVSQDPSAVSILDILATPTPIGCMSSRPVRLFIWDRANVIHDKMAYYWDHLCVHRDFQKKNLGRNLIQTLEYVQRDKNPDIPFSIFKKEQTLCEGIVPLVKYKVSTFYLRNIRIPPLPPNFTVVRIFLENMDILSDFLYGISHPQFIDQKSNDPKNKPNNNSQNSENKSAPFSFCTFPEIGALAELVKSQLWYIYAVKRDTHIYGLYFLKNAKTTYDPPMNTEQINANQNTKKTTNPLNLLECVSSVSNMSGPSNSGLLFAGFLHALRDIMGLSDPKYRMISFTDLGHNGQILDKWRWKYSPLFEYPAAYYMYNMVVPGMPVQKERCLILL